MTGGTVTTASLTDFFAVLHPPNGAGFIDLRALPSTRQAFIRPSDIEAVERFIHAHPQQNIYLGIASRMKRGDGSLMNCGELHALFADIDFKVTPEPEAMAKLEGFLLKASIAVRSGGGLHVYWLLREPFDLQNPEDCTRAKNLLRRLALELGGDLSAAEPARILRVPGTLNHKPEYATPRPVVIEVFTPALRYNPSDLDDLLPAEAEAATNGHEQRADWLTLLQGVKAGDRHGVATRLAGHFLGIGRPVEEVEALILGFLSRCDPPGDREKQAEFRRLVRDFAAKDAATGAGDRQASATPEAPWPVLDEAALQGLTGEIVRAIDPHTEADPVAVLAQLLAFFGCVVGREPHFTVEYTQHAARLFVALVGGTSKGRKGQSTSSLKHLLSLADPDFRNDQIKGGMSSGEGLIWQVRDPMHGKEGKIVDEGVTDKRLIILEPELAQALKVMTREGNILSMIVRQAWDGETLSPLTKNNPVAAAGSHISVVGHITQDELLRHLGETEMANGFANRFIFLVVKRSKCLPNPKGVPAERIEELAKALKERIKQAKETADAGSLQRDDEAEQLWAEVYPVLSEGKPGLTGAVLGRAEAQVMRLALTYALLDGASCIQTPHLLAALALWEYAEASVKYIFGEATGDTVADRILEALRGQGVMSETEIYRDLFQRNVKSVRIHRALETLKRSSLIEGVIEETSGRKKTVWRVTH